MANDKDKSNQDDANNQIDPSVALAEAQDKLREQEEAIAKREATIKQMEADANKANKATSETAAKQLAANNEALRMQELDAAEREDRIATLEAQVAKTAAAAEAANPGANLPTFESGGKNYRFRYPKLNFGKGRKLTAEQISEDADLCDELVANGSAAIEEV